MNLKRYLLMPLETSPLLLAGLLALVQTFAIGTALDLKDGLLSLPFILIFTSWFFKYCYALMDAMAAGDREPPVMSYEMINPLNDQRPLAQLGIVSAGVALTWAAYSHLGTAAGTTVGAALLLALPATIALLSIGDTWLHALWPPALLRVIRGMGHAYLLALLITLAAAVLIGVLAVSFRSSLFMVILLSHLALLLVFSVIGGSIFERRVELGFETASIDERRASRDQRDRMAQRGAMLDRAFSLLRLKRRKDAWEEIQQWVRTHCAGDDAFAEYHALLSAASQWEDPVPADRLASEYLDRLLAAGQTGMAVDVLTARLAQQPGFRPATPATTVRLIELARLAGRGAVSRQLQAGSGAPGGSEPV